MHLVKIVRDKIPSLSDLTEHEFGGRVSEGVVSYRSASPDEVVAGLRKKLVEEALEYLLDPSAEELADVIEVAHALRHWDLQIEPTELHEVGTRKLDERGGFFDGIGMFVS